MPPKPPDFEPADHLIVDAVGIVAERSFFAFVDACDPPRIYDDEDREWLVATVRFEDGPVAGRLECSLRADLAQVLFDAFSGRHPSSPLPPEHELDDLIGEFSNMICGTWLTRCASQRAFNISPPVVVHTHRPAEDEHHRHWVCLNSRPLAIDWEVESRPDAVGSNSWFQA
jgi:CheY-specific phosphatase CheX